jgi:hypothetical protein
MKEVTSPEGSSATSADAERSLFADLLGYRFARSTHPKT